MGLFDKIKEFFQEPEEIEEIEEQELKCIICGEPSNGKHFCFECWKKYKDRSIDIRIKNCRPKAEILDEYGNKEYECEDGRWVRSRAESKIADWLHRHNIRYQYEREISYEENGVNKKLHPDFYLFDYDLYIEYNERKDEDYLKKKKYANNIYEKLGYDVIIMGDKDIKICDRYLRNVLKLK